MKTQVSKNTLAALDRLGELIRDDIKPVPDGWFEVAQAAEYLQCSERHAYRELERRIKLGEAEHKNWTKIGLMGKRVRFRIFRMK